MEPRKMLREDRWAAMGSGWNAVEVRRLEVRLVGGVLMSAIIDSTLQNCVNKILQLCVIGVTLHLHFLYYL